MKKSEIILEDEIDLLEIIKKLYKKRFALIIITSFFTIIGIVYSLSVNNIYESSTTFIPQLSGNDNPRASSSLSGLASLAGINITGLSEDAKSISPSLYPKIIESIDFKLELLNSELEDENKKISLREYYKQGSVSIFNNLVNNLETTSKNNNNRETSIENKSNLHNNIYLKTSEDFKLFKRIDDNLGFEVNQKEGFITISFRDKNKYFAAKITESAQSILQKRIIEYKINSSTVLLNFSRNQLELKKNEFNELQDELAYFSDNNLNIKSSLLQNKIERLNSELDISKAVVQQLSSQLEQIKIQVNKNTPVFTILNPVSIPYERVSPKRKVIVLTFFSIGLIVSIVNIFFVEKIKYYFREVIK